ncbi:hypothetical protein D9753_03785 [Streptomyces dangxiongensis]|uniref:Uncharacterized protein n=1 Tax=Streptomyces dangxiongensis TaxID=1442032 RepID=A0A3G2J7I7_9ACTN|nr:hypothetical protein D9753_03785 [Streptomyces dangxiongensis]
MSAGFIAYVARLRGHAAGATQDEGDEGGEPHEEIVDRGVCGEVGLVVLVVPDFGIELERIPEVRSGT